MQTPQNKEMEKAVIGTMLVFNHTIAEALDELKPEHFYIAAHGYIFEAISQLYHLQKQVDPLTVGEQLRKNGKLDDSGGQFFLIELTNLAVSSSRIDYYCAIVKQKQTQRQLLQLSKYLQDKNLDETTNVFEHITEVYEQLNQISGDVISSDEELIKDLLSPQIERAVKIGTGEIKPGIPSPFSLVNTSTGGFRDSELIILAARPGMGKTAMSLNIAKHAARLGYPTAYFSLEMSKGALANRLISQETGIKSEDLNRKGITMDQADQAHKALEPLRNSQLIIDDTSAINIGQMQIKCKRLKAKHGIRLIIVDYLQLMTAKGQNREQEISKISAGLKQIAKQLQVPVIALAQLSRKVEDRGGNKKPLLSDIRQSGAIEQDADIVSFLYRPEYYDMDWPDGEHSEGQAEWIFAKNRNGSLGNFRIGFEADTTNFHNLQVDYSQPQTKDNWLDDDEQTVY